MVLLKTYFNLPQERMLLPGHGELNQEAGKRGVAYSKYDSSGFWNDRHKSFSVEARAVNNTLRLELKGRKTSRAF
jgi:hypothetical protein